MQMYEVKKLPHHPKLDVTVPGSKSMTNRALLLAALAEGESTVSGILFSDDSNVFLQALKDVGFTLQIDMPEKRVMIQGKGGRLPRSQANIYVGSAGTAARFLTAMAAMSDGEFRFDASAQMKKRPMADLLKALEDLGAGIQYLCEEGTFPVRVSGMGYRQSKAQVSINIDKSSQFLSALLMTAPTQFDELEIQLTGTRSALSYVKMTEQMMKQFGHAGVIREADDRYRVIAQGGYHARDYMVEPDVSAACYFYAMVPLLGIPVCVEHVHFESLQGDVEFLRILEKMGCTAQDTEKGVLLLPPSALSDAGTQTPAFHGITVDMSSCSDQAITLAAIAPFADSPTCITGIGHIRFQESDRIHAICTELTHMGIRCEETQDSITIYPGTPKPCTVATYDDHRMAMGFALTGLRTEGIVIDDPGCCRKTFENYFEVLDQVITEISEG